jgi:integrase
VDAWLRAANITSGPIFRAVHRSGSVSPRGLHPGGSHVAAVVKDAAEDAGLAIAEHSGHSLRAGLVTAAAKAGRSTRSIKKTTGHRSDATVEKYIRGLELMEDIAASGLLSGNGGGAWRGR